tara:strand:+ start:2413 stop:3558 length:1146 start_codon:yes stop_codon:yes gene_type:complete
MFYKNHVFLAFLIVTFVSLSPPIFSTSAQAKLKVCNETGELRDVAIGYKADGEWTSEGWWKIEDGECKVVINEDLKRTFYYYRTVHKRGDFDGQAFNFCTQAKPFTIEGDKDCGSRGFNTSKFRELKLLKGTTGFTLTLNDTSIYEADKRVAKVEPKPEPKTESQPQATPETKQDPRPVSDPVARPGTYGEPYDVISIFRGCNADPDENYCEFTADGWRYIVSDNGKTSSKMLDQIANFIPDQRYQIRGDVMDYGDISASVTIRGFDIINDNQEQQLLNKMVGLWRSLDDSNSTIRFTPEGQQITYYEDEFGSEFNVSVTRTCADPSVYQSGEIILQTTSISSADDIYCYGIDLITKDRLTLIYLPRGNFLKYEKDLGLVG